MALEMPMISFKIIDKTRANGLSQQHRAGGSVVKGFYVLLRYCVFSILLSLPLEKITYRAASKNFFGWLIYQVLLLSLLLFWIVALCFVISPINNNANFFKVCFWHADDLHSANANMAVMVMS